MGRDDQTDGRMVGSNRSADRTKVRGVTGAMSFSADLGALGTTACAGLKLSERRAGDVVFLFGGGLRGRADCQAGTGRAIARGRKKSASPGPTAPI